MGLQKGVKKLCASGKGRTPFGHEGHWSLCEGVRLRASFVVAIRNVPSLSTHGQLVHVCKTRFL